MAAVLRLVLFISTPLIIVNAVVPPIIGELYVKGEKKMLEQILRFSATAASVPAFALTAIYIAAPGRIMGFAFGESYQTYAAVWILVILSLGKLISVLLGSCGNTLIMTGNQGRMMKIAIVGGAVSIITGLALIRPLGIIGAALASTLGLVVQNVFMWFSARRLTGIYTHSTFLLLPDLVRSIWMSIRRNEESKV